MTHALNIVWNPSEGIDLGFFIIRYYSLMFVIAFGLGWYIMKKIFEREGESIEKLDTLFIWTVLATLIGARLGHVFFYDWEYYRNHLIEMSLLPEETRMRVSILDYIQERTHLSRSSVLNVLSALKSGNYIVFKRGGYLIELNNLPERF